MPRHLGAKPTQPLRQVGRVALSVMFQKSGILWEVEGIYLCFYPLKGQKGLLGCVFNLADILNPAFSFNFSLFFRVTPKDSWLLSEVNMVVFLLSKLYIARLHSLWAVCVRVAVSFFFLLRFPVAPITRLRLVPPCLRKKLKGKKWWHKLRSALIYGRMVSFLRWKTPGNK